MAAPPSRLTGVVAIPPLLWAAQAARLYADSKILVDMPLAAPLDGVTAAFDALDLPEAPEERTAALRQFCDRWLLPAGSDLVDTPLPQLASGPPAGWLPAVTQPEVRAWAEHLFLMWGSLCRQAAPSVEAHPQRHTLLAPQGHAPFVIPSPDRFREMYYWDTFWSLRGLLVCGLVEVAQGILRNMLGVVEAFGHMPNGMRSYYLNRSQPPLLSQMAMAVHAAAPDLALLRRALGALRREHAFWTAAPKQVQIRGADGRLHRLARYCATWDQPRPESHREDVATAEGLDDAAARQLWRDLSSAAESGWDFSSRWLADGRTLATCRTTRVVPADLNGMLHQMESNVAAIAAELGEHDVAAAFRQHAADRAAAINALLWDAGTGQWRDLLLEGGGADAGVGAAEPPVFATFSQSGVVAASNWVPLYCGCAPADTPQAAAAVAGLRGSGLVQAAGVAVTLSETGQQWDWPNSWPPLTCMLLEGCEAYGGADGAQLAAELARQYLTTALAAWRHSGRMHEKFDAVRAGYPGGGGEYECIDGFGWTNGVALLLLQRYGWAVDE